MAYGISYAAAGRMMDWIGERKGFALAVAVWSVAAVAHGLVRPLVYSGLPWLNAAFAGTFLGSLTPAIVSVAGFSGVRFVLGLAEGGNFPGAIKTVGLWHPKSERAMATGIFNSGSNVGIIIAAYSVPFIVHEMKWGWPAAFYLTGALGCAWVTLWLTLYERPEKHPRVSPAELQHIRSDPPDPPANVSWLGLLKHRQTWAYTLAMFLVSPVWWFYLYWMPKFLKNNHGIDLARVFWPLLLVYLMADAGSLAGGGLSSWLIRRRASVNVARKTTFLTCVSARPGRVRGAGEQYVGGGAAGRAGCRRTRGFLRKSVHDRLRHGPPQGGRLGRRHRGRRRMRRHVVAVDADRLGPRLDPSRVRRKGLPDPVLDCRFRVSGRHGNHPPAAAAAGADCLRRGGIPCRQFPDLRVNRK